MNTGYEDDRFSANKKLFPPPRHNFGSFIHNRKNRPALNAARQAVQKALFPSCTLFVIFGRSGSGKTHLLGAMANALAEAEPEAPFFYGGLDYLEAIPSGSVRERVIFLDDIQRAYSDPPLQDSLVSLIDLFHFSRRLVVLCADARPTDSPDGSGLRSRLDGGLAVELKKPDLDVRRQYLQLKNSALKLGLDSERVLSLARRHQDLREIDIALTMMSACRPPDGEPETFPEDASENRRVMLGPEHIISLVAEEFSVSGDDIGGKKRDPALSLARSVAMLLCRELLGLSLARTGRLFGGRNHASVIYSLNKIKMLLESDKNTHKQVAALRQMCLSWR